MNVCRLKQIVYGIVHLNGNEKKTQRFHKKKLFHHRREEKKNRALVKSKVFDE